MLELTMEAEASVIGGLLIDFARTKRVLTELSPDEFFNEYLKKAFQVIQGLANEGKAVDFVTVLAGVGDTCDTKLLLAQCVELIPSLANFEAYVNIVKEQAQKRRILAELQDLAFGTGYSAADMLSRLREILDKEQTQDTGYSENMMLYKIAEYRGLLYSDNNENKVPTGFSSLDRILGSLEKENFTVIGARPAMGKTAFAGCLAVNMVQKGKRVDFFSLEMPDNQLFSRIASNRLSMDHSKIRDGKLSVDEKEQIIKMLMKLTESKDFYLFDDVYTIERIENIVSRNHPDVVIIDYLQLVDSVTRFKDTLERVSHVSRACKRIAKQYKCQVIALAQLSRAVDSRPLKVPVLSDLRECGQIEQDADIVMFLYREFMYNREAPPELAQAIIAKARHGETGVVDFHFDGAHQRFLPLEKYRADQWQEVDGGSWPPAGPPAQSRL